MTGETIVKEFAIETLKKYFTDRYSNLKDVEKRNFPDLVDDENKIGIEITRAVNQGFLKDLDAHSKNKMKDFRNTIHRDRYLWVPKKEETATKLKQIKDSYNKKLKKINGGNYDAVKIVDLFILSSIKDDFDPQIFFEIFETSKSKNFRYIYIVAYFKIYEIDLMEKYINKLEFDNRVINEIVEENKGEKCGWL